MTMGNSGAGVMNAGGGGNAGALRCRSKTILRAEQLGCFTCEWIQYCFLTI